MTLTFVLTAVFLLGPGINQTGAWNRTGDRARGVLGSSLQTRKCTPEGMWSMVLRESHSETATLPGRLRFCIDIPGAWKNVG